MSLEAFEGKKQVCAETGRSQEERKLVSFRRDRVSGPSDEREENLAVTRSSVERDRHEPETLQSL